MPTPREFRAPTSTPTSRRNRALGASIRFALPTLVVVLLGVGGAFAAGQASVRNNVINACYATSGAQRGVLRIDTRCRKNEKPISWNQQGLPGATGPQGADGSAGADGATGPKGDTGATGPRGDDGMMGISGLTGTKGDTGPKGEQGDVGEPGPPGPQGATGPIGSIGPIGPSGPQGPEGMMGIAGLTGAKGDAGLTGASGPAGPTGPTGSAGPQGPKGDTGAQGLPGPMGLTGPAGGGTSTAPPADATPSCGIGATLADGMTQDSFLKLSNGISGESTDAQFHVGEIETHGFCLGGARAFGIGAIGSPGGPNYTTFTVSMNVDSATPTLLATLGRGQSIATAQLTARHQGEFPRPYASYAFDSLYVTAVEVRMVKGVMYQQVTFAWRKLTMSYTRYSKAGLALTSTFVQDNSLDLGRPVVADAGDGVCAGPARMPSWGRTTLATTLQVGSLGGESVLDAGAFDADGFCIGVTSDNTLVPGGNVTVGQPRFTALDFRKRIDSATPPLLQAFAGATVIPSATLRVYGAGAPTLPFLTMAFGANYVAEYQQVAETTDVDEHGSLGWNTIDFEYRPQSSNGTLRPAIPFKYDALRREVTS